MPILQVCKLYCSKLYSLVQYKISKTIYRSQQNNALFSRPNVNDLTSLENLYEMCERKQKYLRMMDMQGHLVAQSRKKHFEVHRDMLRETVAMVKQQFYDKFQELKLANKNLVHKQQYRNLYQQIAQEKGLNTIMTNAEQEFETGKI